MTTLFIEPFGGMAGDMFLAALLDLGDPRFSIADLSELAEALVPGEARVRCEPARRGSIAASLVVVETPESAHPPHRHFSHLAARIDDSPLPDGARARARAALWRIAEAEARVHGTTPEAIHFHEIGAVDTLVDVCGAALGLARLGVERVVASPPLAGSGTVRCAHGEMPVPTPAVVELLRGRPIVLGGEGERLTPTGAAILAEWVESFAPLEAFVPRAVGYGAGARDPREGPPNLVRVQLGDAGTAPTRADAWLLEVNLDDMTGEEVGHAVRELRAAGALDVWVGAVSMKKDRPGVVVSALARAEGRAALEAALLEHTTTLGLRWRAVERLECARRTITVEVDGSPVRVKVRGRPAYPGASPFGERDLSPEHDDLERVARASGATLREVRRRAIEAALGQLAPGDAQRSRT